MCHCAEYGVTAGYGMMELFSLAVFGVNAECSPASFRRMAN